MTAVEGSSYRASGAWDDGGEQFDEHADVASNHRADARLAALLQSKPDTEPIPLAAWWFIAASLQSSVQVRRCLEGVESLTAETLAQCIQRAHQAAGAALEELPESPAGAQAVDRVAMTCVQPVAALRCSVLALARLTVRSRATTTAELRGALLTHMHALWRCHASDSRSNVSPPNLAWAASR